MQEPRCPMGPLPTPTPPRRRRQKRTVYSAEQRQELERIFVSNQYPAYQERETLAARLNLQEHQVQVWFKNRRAKYTRLLGPSRCQGSEAQAAPQSPGACASEPAPATANPVFPGDPVLSQGQGFCSPPLPSPLGVFPAAEPNVSSHSQAWWDPAQVDQMIPAAPAPAPAPAPVWPQGPYASDFSPDPVVIHGFTELSSFQDPLEGPSSSSTPWYQLGDDSADEDSGPRTLLNL